MRTVIVFALLVGSAAVMSPAFAQQAGGPSNRESGSSGRSAPERSAPERNTPERNTPERGASREPAMGAKRSVEAYRDAIKREERDYQRAYPDRNPTPTPTPKKDKP